MKKILLSLLCVVGIFSAGLLNAQTTFSASSDTVFATVVNSATINNYITNISSSNITLKWNVVATNFPADWQVDSAFGICDNVVCRGNSNGVLWNGASGNLYTTGAYTPGNPGAFSLALNLSNASAGMHYVTVRLTDVASATTKNITFVINKFPTAVSNVNAADPGISLYPNPANDELNVLYNVNAEIKTIAVYNVIGKVMNVYRVSGSSANLNISSIPSGIYFVRLTNAHGDAVVTRKFTKQ